MTLQAKFNHVSGKPLVLLSPLDWGLGHTTRCVPVIQQLIKEGCQVIVACNSLQKSLLEAEFPSIFFLDLPGYGIRYAKNRWITIGRLVWQLPKMIIRIKKEHRWLKQFLRTNRVDAIISDNRFGFYAKGVPSVFITHQLSLRTGLGKWADKQAMKRNYSMINKFSEVWVPDNGEGYAIAGALSKPDILPDIRITYIGGISRFENCGENNQLPAYSSTGFEQPLTPGAGIELLIILSGPEPQRTLFEQLLIQQLKSFKGSAVVVRALPEKSKETASHLSSTELQHITFYDHVPGASLNQLICQAGLVISRSGYTTVMDLLKTKKKSILVPTPGQAEQEYLAVHLEKEQLACRVQQHEFILHKALEKAASFPFKTIDDDMQGYKTTITAFVNSLRK